MPVNDSIEKADVFSGNCVDTLDKDPQMVFVKLRCVYFKLISN